MNNMQILDSVLAGKPCMLVEFRGASGEILRWSHAKTGRAMSATVLVSRVETVDSAVKVNEFQEDGVKPDDCKSPFAKGDKLVLVLESLKVERGATSAGGALFPYTGNLPAASPALVKL